MCECTMSRVQTTEGLSSTSELTTHDPWTFQFIVQVWIMLSFLWKPYVTYVMCFYLMAGTHKVFMIESWWITNCQQFLCLQWVPPHAFALYLFKLISGFQPSPTNHGACKWGQRSLAPAGIPATPCFSSFSLRNVTGPRKQETKKTLLAKKCWEFPPIFWNYEWLAKVPICEEETQHESFNIILFRLTQPRNPKHLTKKIY